jgi:hypothetical protein
MNRYRVRARFKAHGFTVSVFEHFSATTAAQAIKKGIEHFRNLDNMPATEELLFISAFFVGRSE